MTERRLTPADACWLYSDFEGNHQTVSALMWLDAEVDPDTVRSVIKDRLVDQYPTFKQKIRNSRNPLLMPHWVDDDEFDLDYHLEVLTLPAPGGKAELEAVVSAQRSQMLDHSKPLWRFHLIQGYNGTSAIHARVQHAIADGWALVRLIMSLADEASEKPTVEVVEKERQRKRDKAMGAAGPVVEAFETAKDAVGDVVDAVTGALKDPKSVPAKLASGADALQEALNLSPDPARFQEFGSQLADTVSGVPGAVAEQVAPVSDAVGVATGSAQSAIDFLNGPKPGKTILHGKVSGTKKVSWIDPIPLQPLKDAGRALNATLNDLLMGASTNALRQYLISKNSLDVDNLLVSVPISLRRADEPLPRELGNKFGLVNVQLPVGIADPLEQVANIKAQVDDIKQSQLPVVSFGLVSVAAITTPQVERLLHKVTQEQSTGVVTNVPGPRAALTLAGANVIGAWGLGGVGGNMNLCLGIFSLNGEVNFAVSSDTAITPDPEAITALFVPAVQELMDLAAAK